VNRSEEVAYCANCGTAVAEDGAFCPNCGTSQGTTVGLIQQPALAPVSSTAAGPLAYAGVPEEKGRRVVAYLIDIVPMLLLSLIHFLPVIGWMFYGALHVLYWLLRDIGGASLGKTVLGSYVASQNGGLATTSQRILRNVPLALPGLIGMIPLIGIFFELAAAVVIFGGEAILLLATGSRFGDRLAGTTVLRK
jgi:uncharacterized RDD family membrane protein YckC